MKQFVETMHGVSPKVNVCKKANKRGKNQFSFKSTAWKKNEIVQSCL